MSLRIAITGSSLCRATALAAVLRERGHQPARLNAADLASRTQIRRALAGFDAVVHLPTLSRRRSASSARSPTVRETFEMVAGALVNDVPRFVLASPHPSGAITRDDATLPGLARADDLDRPAPWCEKVVLDASRQGANALVVHHGAVIGPYSAHTPVGRLLLRLMRDAHHLLPPWEADCIDVRDVAIGLADAVERGLPGRRYVLRGHLCREQDVAAAVGKLIGRAVRYWVLPPRIAQALRMFRDDDGAELDLLAPPCIESAEIGCAARPFERSVADTLGWYTAQGLISG